MWLYVLASVAVVSAVSLVGAVTLSLSDEKLRRWLLYLVSFSVGALLGDVFLHLLPELAEGGLTATVGAYILAGILLFFVLERFILWQHTHGEHKEEVHSVVYLTMVGDTLHNFIDGMIIAGSYLVSPAVGVATTLAVVFHEIPQEMGNFAILVHGGWSKAKALWYNFFSAFASIIGAVVVLSFVRGEAAAPVPLVALGVASFLYIAMTDIIPQLNAEKDARKSGWQLLWFLVGIGAMATLLLLE